MSIARSTAVALAAAALTAGAAGRAHAGDNDLILSRLSTQVGTGADERTVGESLELRSLLSELGVALAPRLLTPSDTIGFGGFQLTADLASTTISSDASYWRVLASSPSPTATADGTSHGAGALPTVGVFVRKGMWFPVPSIEFGGGAVHLMDSRLWTGQAYVKLALLEGYHKLPVPSVAVRGAVSRLFGQKEIDLTILSLDASVSKHFGVAGTWSVDPYAGWNVLMMVPRSEVIDPTPNVDSLDDANMNDRNLDFVFKDQDDITRQRFFVGAKLQYYVFQLTLEAAFARAGSSVDDRASDVACMPNSTTTACDSTDQARSQRTVTVSGGFDF
ncbi:MAG TPA: hypothetical protein VHE35_36340 [Kofleriaceae bacterium]|nr:hypothetical protein [Kofleriaceae bacterium]